MLSLTRSFALRVPFAVLRSAVPGVVQRSSLVAGVPPYRAFSNSPFALAAVAAKRKPVTTKARVVGSKAKPKTKAKPKVKAKSKVKAKPKPKAKAKAKAKPKKVAAKKPPSTRVPLALRPPRKPMTPFIMFYSRTNARETGPITGLAKIASNAWANLTEAEKKPFVDEYKVLQAEYVRAKEKWIRDPKNVQILKTLNKDRKKRGKGRIIMTPPDHVKKPVGPFFRFMDDLRKDPSMGRDKSPPGVRHQTWLAKEGGVKWKTLPADVKDKYIKDSIAAQERFAKEHRV